MNIIKTNKNNFNDTAVLFLKETIEKILSVKKSNIVIALSGGSTPLPILKKLKTIDIQWERISFFIVDERCVPINDSQSNYGNIKSIFFDDIKSNHYPMIIDCENLEKSITTLETIISKEITLSNNNFPVFDLILLGMGEDGHTASLFPNTKALKNNSEIIVKNYVPQLDSMRVTFTYPTILKSSEIVVLIKGKRKKQIFEQMNQSSDTNYPMQKIVNERKDLNWIIED